MPWVREYFTRSKSSGSGRQVLIFGAAVVLVLVAHHNDEKDGKNPSPKESGRYPVTFEHGKDNKDKKKPGPGKKDDRPVPHSTVSYPIKFPHHDRDR